MVVTGESLEVEATGAHDAEHAHSAALPGLGTAQVEDPIQDEADHVGTCRVEG